jgi:Winged helix DNA-binding domain
MFGMTTTGSTLRRLRLAAQRIEGSEFSTPTEVVTWMLALQGQDLPGAKWSVGLRAPGSTLADVDDALARGDIVRSWPMRGTLHLVPAVDIGWMLQLTGERTLRSLLTRHRELGLDDATFGQARDIAAKVLEGGRSATRAELFQAFEAAGIATTGQRGPHLIGQLHQTRQLCLGPMRGNDQAVVLLDEWVPSPRRLDREESLGEFVRRYFTSHGPATLRDFAWWTKLPVRDMAIGMTLAREHLEELVVDEVSYWMAPGLPDRASRRVHALPGFDEFLLGYQDRGASLAAEHAPVIVPGNNGMFQSTIVIGGSVAGLWRRKKTAAGVTVSPLPFEALSARQLSGFGVAATAYGRFLGVPVTVAAPPDDRQPATVARR